MSINKISEVYRTKDYEQFKFMPENRAVTDLRMKKVRKSIKDNGYIFNPIIINEKNEIIDGQCRFTVLREMELPVDYIMYDGLTAKDCAALNANTTPWNLKDYIQSYMEQGIRDYGYLFHLVNKYDTDGIGINAVVFAINGTVESQNNIIKNAAFKCSEDQYEMADELLGYLKKFMPTMKRGSKGRTVLMELAIMFAYKMRLVDGIRLIEKFNLYYTSDIAPYFTNMETALKTLNEIYNYHRANKIHLEIEYEKYQASKYPWYTVIHGK